MDAETAREQMALDERLASETAQTVRCFRWRRPAVSLGWKQPRPDWVAAQRLHAHGIEVVERPTGGGVALHGSDLSWSVVSSLAHSPSLAQLLEEVAAHLVQGVERCGVAVAWRCEAASRGRLAYCLTQESAYALMIGSRKLGGLAIRRYRKSWLIQGSVLVRPLPEVFDRVMPEQVRTAFQTRAVSLEEAARYPIDEEDVARTILEQFNGKEGGVAVA